MSVAGGFFIGAVAGSALCGIRSGDGDVVLVAMIAVCVMQMAVMDIVGVAVVLNRYMAAARSVLMWMRVSLWGGFFATSGASAQSECDDR